MARPAGGFVSAARTGGAAAGVSRERTGSREPAGNRERTGPGLPRAAPHSAAPLGGPSAGGAGREGQAAERVGRARGGPVSCRCPGSRVGAVPSSSLSRAHAGAPVISRGDVSVNRTLMSFCSGHFFLVE